MIQPVLVDQAFVADLDQSADETARLNLWWIGQSGYVIQSDGRRIVIDPYLSDALTRKYAATEKPHVRMHRRVVDPALLRDVSLITSSHGHTDHLDQETLQSLRVASHGESQLLAPRAIEGLVQDRWGKDQYRLINDRESAVYFGDSLTISAIPSAHPAMDRDGKGNCLYLGYVLQWHDVTIFHSGDTLIYDGMVERLERFAPIDLAILPINGEVGNMNGQDAAQLAKAIGAACVVPCHYDLFEFNTADPMQQFVPECRKIGQAYRVMELGGKMTLENK